MHKKFTKKNHVSCDTSPASRGKCFALFALMTLGTIANAQSSDNVKTSPSTENTKAAEVTFLTQAEKDLEISRVEELIAFRLKQGRTVDQLANYYAELKKIKNAQVINTNSKTYEK